MDYSYLSGNDGVLEERIRQLEDEFNKLENERHLIKDEGRKIFNQAKDTLEEAKENVKEVQNKIEEANSMLKLLESQGLELENDLEKLDTNLKMIAIDNTDYLETLCVELDVDSHNEINTALLRLSQEALESSRLKVKLAEKTNDIKDSDTLWKLYYMNIIDRMGHIRDNLNPNQFESNGFNDEVIEFIKAFHTSVTSALKQDQLAVSNLEAAMNQARGFSMDETVRNTKGFDMTNTEKYVQQLIKVIEGE